MSSSTISEGSTEILTSADELLTMLGTELVHNAEQETTATWNIYYIFFTFSMDFLCIVSFENVNN